MSYHLDESGVKLEFEVREYVPSTENNIDDNWCKIDFSFKHPEGIDYSLLDDETLSAYEIEVLEEALSRLIDGTGEYKRKIQFIEPYFEFNLSRDEEDAIFAEWIVRLWIEYSLTDCYFSVPLYREEIIELRDYLRQVMGESE